MGENGISVASRKARARSIAHPVFAACYRRSAPVIEAGPVGTARRDLLGGAVGVVVDVGAGVGLNLPHLGPAASEVHLVEPDRHMVRMLEREVAAGHHRRATIHQERAEALPFPTGSVDTVLATLTLCTVQEVAAAVAEMRRVLAPGGQLLVLEHVRSRQRGLARWQDGLARPWGWFAGGCRPNRDTAAALAAGGFDITGLRLLAVPEWRIVPDWLVGAASVGA